MKDHIYSFMVAAALVFAWIPAFADDAGYEHEYTADVVELDEITVLSREAARAKEVITDDDIVQPQHSRTVDGLLKSTAGIDITRMSPGGGAGSGAVTLRGFDESRFLILLDGRPLNGCGVYGGDYVDWASLSTEDIERIEVIRGAASAEYGNTLGGVVNIITRQGAGDVKTDLSLSCGSFNTLDTKISNQGSPGDLFNYDVSLGYWQTDGYLRNNYVNRTDLNTRFTFTFANDWKLGIGASYTTHERGFIVENIDGSTYYDNDYPESDEDGGGGPGLLWWGNPGPFGPPVPSLDWGDGSYWVNIREQYDVSLSKSFGLLNLAFRTYLNDQYRTEYYHAIDDEDDLVLERTAKPEDNTWGWLFKIDQTVEKHRLKYGAEGTFFRYGDIDIESVDNSYFRIAPSSSEGAGENSRTHSLFIQDTWDLKPLVDLDFGLRYDNYRADEEERVVIQGFSPNTGVAWKAWEHGVLTANLAYAYRFPTCPESYWYYAGYQPSDREDLLPEKALQVEIGAEHVFKENTRVVVRTFHYVIEDYLRTIFGYSPSRVVYNIDEVTISGIELEGEYTVSEHLSMFANFTLQKTDKKGDIFDESGTEELVELPDEKANAGIRYYGQNGLKAALALRYVGKRGTVVGSLATPGASSVEEMGGFVTVDGNVSYPVWKKEGFNGTVRLGAENIFSRDYEEVYGFPMPGIAFTLGIDMVF